MTSSPLEQAARLRVRDQIVALGAALRHAPGGSSNQAALKLIELAAKPDTGARRPDEASGPVELITKIPSRWRARHADDALTELARSWQFLDADVRPLALALGRDRWLRTAIMLAEQPNSEDRLAAAQIAHDSCDPGFGKMVCRLMRDEEQRVRKLADDALLRLALQLLDDVPDSLLGKQYAAVLHARTDRLPADPQVLRLEQCVLLRAITDAAWGFAAHRCRSPLIATLLLMDRPAYSRMEKETADRMRRLLSERQHPSHAPIRTVLKRTDCPLLRERALRWLAIDAIGSAAIDRLMTAETMTEHVTVLDSWVLAIRPRRAAKLGAISSPRSRAPIGNLLPGAHRWDQLSESSKLGVIGIDALINDAQQSRRARIEPALADDSTHVRLRCASLCPSMDLADFIFDTDPGVSRHAAIRWSTLGIEPPKIDSPSCIERIRICEHNTRSVHAVTRAIAIDELARLSISDPHHPASRSRARKILHADPTGFVRMMRDRLAMPESRVDAITMIRLLGVEHRFELDLIGMIQSEHADERARASAIAAIAVVDSSAAKYVLSESMRSDDPRVRANAIEYAPVPGVQLVEFKDDPNHRVRANAIRRLIESKDEKEFAMAQQAGAELAELLADPRPMHRLAGAWVAQRTVVTRGRDRIGRHWSPIIVQLEELAATDEDVRLRDRASQCIRRLRTEIRNDSGRTGTLADDGWGS
jgi:hypothetical protein